MQVFISHAEQDGAIAGRLADALSKAGLDPWLPEDELLPGDNWALVLGRALAQSDAMVVLLSPRAVRSPSVARDIQYALGSINYAHRLVSVIAEPVPAADIPWILQSLPIIKAGKIGVPAARLIAQHLQGFKKATG